MDKNIDEFLYGIWWVPDGTGGLRNASPMECAAEIKRLRETLRSISQRSQGDIFHMERDIHSMCAMALP